MIDNSEEVKKILSQKIKNAANEIGFFITTEAKKRCPVNKGLLRGSIIHEVEEKEDSAIVYVGTNTEYAPYVEKGTGLYAEDGNGRKTPWTYPFEDGFVYTVGQKPQPFLYPAFDENKKKIQDFVKEAFK